MFESTLPEWKIKPHELVSNDERGWMVKEVFSDKVLWLVFTIKGFGRGGEIHPVFQSVSVVSGCMEFRMMFPDGEIIRKVFGGQHIRIPNGIPHIGIAIENTIMIEWHDGELPDFKDKQIYEPYRRLIYGKVISEE